MTNIFPESLWSIQLTQRRNEMLQQIPPIPRCMILTCSTPFNTHSHSDISDLIYLHFPLLRVQRLWFDCIWSLIGWIIMSFPGSLRRYNGEVWYKLGGSPVVSILVEDSRAPGEHDKYQRIYIKRICKQRSHLPSLSQSEPLARLGLTDDHRHRSGQL